MQQKSQNSKKMRLGIISALYEEQQGLVEAMQGVTTVIHGMRQYTHGQLWQMDAVCVLSRIGKVAAAMTATSLVEKFGVTHIVFTGLAGSGDETVDVGDIVVADTLVQHDMDARPLFPRFEVPLTKLSTFQSDLVLSNALSDVARHFFDADVEQVLSSAERAEFGIARPKLHRGLIASGDQFIHGPSQLAELRQAFPALLAVEMEGAAVAQVCFELGIPFAVVRTISDKANNEAAVDFMKFVQTIASRYAFHIVKRLCLSMDS